MFWLQLRGLISFLARCTRDDPKAANVRTLAQSLKESIENRFTQLLSLDEPEMLIGTVVDPHYKLTRFHTTDEREKACQLVLDAMEHLRPTVVSPRLPLSANNDAKPEAVNIEDLDDACLSLESSSLALTGPTSSNKNELERYCAMEPLQRSGSTIEQAASTLSWWAAHRHQFPVLARVARKVLCIPPTSAESERLFSACGDIVNEKRSRLSPENADILVFIDKNIGMKSV